MKKDSGFGLIYVIGAVLVVAAIVAAGIVVHNNNDKTTNTTVTSNSTTQTAKNNNQKYLVISEWKVKLPLSSTISDAYYVVSTSSQNSNEQPNTIWLGLKSLDSAGNCDASKANSGQTPLASLGRTLLDERDPVSGQTYQQKYPDGSTLGTYYYSYNGDWIKNEPCTTEASQQTNLQDVNTAFAAAAKNIVAE